MDSKAKLKTYIKEHGRSDANAFAWAATMFVMLAILVF